MQAFPLGKHDRNFSLLTKISWNLIHKKGEIQARWQWNVTEVHAIDISATYATADSSGKVDCSHFEWLRKMSTPSFKRSVLLLANVKKQGWDLLVVSQLAIAGKYFFLASAKSRWMTFKGWNNIFKLISVNLGALRVTVHHAPVLHSPDGTMLLDPVLVSTSILDLYLRNRGEVRWIALVPGKTTRGHSSYLDHNFSQHFKGFARKDSLFPSELGKITFSKQTNVFHHPNAFQRLFTIDS